MQKSVKILGIAVAALIAVAVVLQLLRGQVTTANLGELERRLTHEDAAVRHEAAAAIQRINPEHPSARLVNARALIELGRRTDARQILTSLTADAATPGYVEAVALLTRSYLDEATEQLMTADVDLAFERASPVIDLALSAHELAGERAAKNADLLNLEARALDLRATFMQRRLYARVLDLAKARAVNFEQQVESLGLVVDQVRATIAAVDAKLATICKRARAVSPGDSRPYLYEFHLYLRAERYPDARGTASRLLALPSIDRAVAGEIAHTLLDSENLYARPVTAEDASLARDLLASKSLTAEPSIWYDLSEARLALWDRRYADAERLTKAIIHNPDTLGHPRATTMLGIAMIEQNRASEAVTLMTRATELAPSSEGLMVKGIAILATGDPFRARETLRQSIDMDPQNLPARLAMIQALFDRNAILDTEQDLSIAQKINPAHPRVRAFAARLMIEKLDRRGLLAMIAPATALRVITAADTELAARMAIDDRNAVKVLAEGRAKIDPDDTLAMLAQAWLKAGGRRRWEVASLLNERLAQALASDPLRLGEAPTCPAPLAPALLVTVDPNAATEATPIPSEVDARYFVPSLPQAAYQVTRLTALRYPEAAASLKPVLIELALWSGHNDDALQLIASLPEPAAPGTMLDAIREHLEGRTPASTANLPDSPSRRLLQLAALMRNDAQDPAVLRSLSELLINHAWAEHALLMLVRAALERNTLTDARLAIETAEKLNPEMALLAKGRLSLALRRPREALEAAGIVGRDEATDSEIRVQAAEIAARANLLIGQADVATATFDTLAYSMSDRKLPMRLTAIDVLVRSGKNQQAATAISSLTADAQSSPGMLDALLVRAQTVMLPQRFEALLNTIMLYLPEEPMLWLHQARVLTAMGKTDLAGQVIDRLQRIAPGAPRVRELAAELNRIKDKGESSPSTGTPSPATTPPAETGAGT